MDPRFLYHLVVHRAGGKEEVSCIDDASMLTEDDKKSVGWNHGWCTGIEQWPADKDYPGLLLVRQRRVLPNPQATETRAAGQGGFHSLVSRSKRR